MLSFTSFSLLKIHDLVIIFKDACLTTYMEIRIHFHFYVLVMI